MDVRDMLNVLRPYFSSSTSPVAGGATTQLQFNNNGVLAGDSGLVWDNTNKRLGVGTTAPTAPLSISEKCALNSSGGFMVKLTNKTGTATVKGYMVHSNSGQDRSVVLAVKDIPDPIGVFYESGIADGAEAWVVVAGIADVYFVGNTTRGHIARGFITADGASYVSGQALSEAVPSSPFATDKHFYELGHVMESRTGAGLSKVVLHFN